jgi:hypothetical protein
MQFRFRFMERSSFYQDGIWYVVLDAAKKKHKFSLLHEEVIGK